jgi:hypothetical protein
MKAVHWLFLISICLFVSGIGFVVVGARSARQAAPSKSPVAVPVASIKQIMKGIVQPNATIVYNAVGSTITAQGTEERAPKTAEEWEIVGNSAAALIESGNMLLVGNRVLDTGDWVKLAHDLINGGKDALKAAESKSADGVFASGEPINDSCDACHAKYQRR